MPRTAIAPTVLNEWEAVVDEGAGTAVDQANGMSIALGPKPRACVLRVTNAEAGELDVTVPLANGSGDKLTAAIAGGDTAIINIPPGDTNEVGVDDDHEIHVDFEATFTGTVWAFSVQRH